MKLDHLVPLELGGSDGLGNIWPECGPDDVILRERYFRQKDHVENYLATEVRSGRMSLDSAQRVLPQTDPIFEGRGGLVHSGGYMLGHRHTGVVVAGTDSCPGGWVALMVNVTTHTTRA